jgi:hypothetical protein
MSSVATNCCDGSASRNRRFLPRPRVVKRMTDVISPMVQASRIWAKTRKKSPFEKICAKNLQFKNIKEGSHVAVFQTTTRPCSDSRARFDALPEMIERVGDFASIVRAGISE